MGSTRTGRDTVTKTVEVIEFPIKARPKSFENRTLPPFSERDLSRPFCRRPPGPKIETAAVVRRKTRKRNSRAGSSLRESTVNPEFWKGLGTRDAVGQLFVPIGLFGIDRLRFSTDRTHDEKTVAGRKPEIIGLRDHFFVFVFIVANIPFKRRGV